jgi:hypothetical protein
MKQPIHDGILESPLDLNGYGFVNIGGLLGTFQLHSAVLDALAATSPSYVGLSLLQLANPGSDSFLKIQSNGVPVYVAGSGLEAPLTFSAPLVRTGDTISIPAATNSVDGYLGHADWTTFNAKEPALGNPSVSGYVLSSTTGGVRSWIVQSGGSGSVATDTIWDAKGDLAVGTGSDTAVRLAIGANDTIAIADSTQTAGIRWGTPSSIRTALGLVIGTNLQAWDATLDALAAQSTAANTVIYATGLDSFATTAFSALGRALVGQTTTTNARITLGVVIGTDVQAYDAGLTSWAALTRAAGFDTFTATPSVANFKSLLSDETTVVGNLLSLASPSAISFIKIAADNTVSTRTPSQLLGDIAAEPALGNPGTSGFVLSSTTGGVRSWVSGLTNSAGNNIIPKSNGTNLVASAIGDDGTSLSLNPGGSNLANVIISNPLAYSRLVYDTTYVSAENGRINFVAADPPAGGGFRFNTYNVKFGTGGTVQYQGGDLDFAGFSSVTGRIGNANLPLGAQLFDNAGTPKLAGDFGSRQLLANDGVTVALDWSAANTLDIVGGYGAGGATIVQGDISYFGATVQAQGFSSPGGIYFDDSGFHGIGAVIAGTKTATGTATTTFTVTIGVTMANTTYKVTTEGDNALSAAVHYVNNKTTTTFDIVYLAGLTGAVSIDWIVSP